MSDEPAPGALRVAVRTLGCKVNRTESESLIEELLGAGAVLVEEADADFVVVNTCTVTAEADAKARKAVRHALRAPRGPIVIVTGCLAALDPAGLAALDSRVVVDADKERLAQRVIARVLPGPGTTLRSVKASAGDPSPLRGSPGLQNLASGGPETGHPRAFRTRATVKVQDGCDHRCAYCIVPDARGAPRSVPASNVVDRVAALIAGGVREVVLTGVNIGRYTGGLARLVTQVAATGIERIRISSIEPIDLTPALLATLARTPAVMPHLHVPLQSGCDTTLAAMGRGYDTAAFADSIARARDAMPGLALTTDIIVGFPGESAADFAESLAFVEACGFSRLHVFRYSPRPGTPAAAMSERPDPREVADRARRMRALGERLSSAHARARVGGRARVLVERVGDEVATGTTEDYLHVTVRLSPAVTAPRPGDVVPATITAAERGSAWAVLAEC
ncbi:MAG: tRNA (N(6)-L-threonylcarbamoyladenosine(37)-C(2))-methylthiotransferase MtaB [Coriobacteriia bacterium]|nr:tRNA (N(6)-L-threonylcarbamoyladenosine(37)-C(2))-methylthiotransferase MtaB [Coriobacteriia bacterium]